MRILDRMKPGPKNRFGPYTTNDFFALQLAFHLGDVQNLEEYRKLASHYRPAILGAAARRLKPRPEGMSPYSHFERELQRGRFQGPASLPPVIGIRIERRVIGFVALAGGVILETGLRKLSNDLGTVLHTVNTFLSTASQSWDNYPIAIYSGEALEEDFRRAEILGAIRSFFRSRTTPLWEATSAELLSAYSHPPAMSFQVIRRAAARMWPETTDVCLDTTTLLDAAIVAQYVDVLRQLRPAGGSHG